ncbi:hypothetical protein MAHJHV47_44240 [Mycobacterium avium subsp. hominissuis]
MDPKQLEPHRAILHRGQAEHSCEQLIDLAKALATKYFGPSQE